MNTMTESQSKNDDDNNNNNDNLITYEYTDGGRIPSDLVDSVQRIMVSKNVTKLDDHAFDGCGALTCMAFEPDSALTEIGKFVWNDCIALETLHLPSSVRVLGESALTCTALRRFVVPPLVTALPPRLCQDCEDLIEIDLQPCAAVLTSIGSSCFDGCTSLVSVVIPPGMQHVPSFCFRDCTALTAVFVPLTLQSVGSNAWKSCTQLTTLALPEDVQILNHGCNDEHNEENDEHAVLASLEYHPLVWCTTLQQLANQSQSTLQDSSAPQNNQQQHDVHDIWNYVQHVLEPLPLHQAVAWTPSDATTTLTRIVQSAWNTVKTMGIDLTAVDPAKRTVLHYCALNPWAMAVTNHHLTASESTVPSSALTVVLQAAAEIFGDENAAESTTFASFFDFVQATDCHGLAALHYATMRQQRQVWKTSLLPFRGTSVLSVEQWTSMFGDEDV